MNPNADVVIVGAARTPQGRLMGQLARRHSAQRRLRPAFSPTGTVTAGNASPLNDGAAAAVLTTRGYAEAHGLEIMAVLGAPGQTAGPDTSLPDKPARAIGKALETAGWSVEDLDFVEINEAFASGTQTGAFPTNLRQACRMRQLTRDKPGQCSN